MRLPSIRQILHETSSTFSRFPLVIIDAAVGTAAAIVLIDHEGPPEPTILFKILLAAVLGIPLLTGLVLVTERRGGRRLAVLGAQVAGAIVLAGYALTVPDDLANSPAITVIRFFILGFSLQLLVAAAPYLGKGEMNGFWQYNKTLFLRLFTAVLYAVVLYAGLAIALAALDNLFGVNMPGKRYAELWVLINGIFTTSFFLSGVPRDLAKLDTLTDYPRGLKVFAQYILLPLVLVYLAILYAYLAKITLAWDWPQGYVSKLILGFSSVGMLAFLLLYPVTDRAEQSWIRRAARWFYIVLIPLVVMLFLAVWRRVSEYGITEGRYLALALGFWLVFIIAYNTFGKRKSIKVIPASLCVLAFAVSFGPWGAFAVSEQSQVTRLRALLERTAILGDGKIRPTHAQLVPEDAREISSILSYLHEIHGYERIQPWFGESLRADSTGTGAGFKKPDSVARMMGFDYVSSWERAPGGMVFLNAEGNGAFDVRGFEKMVRMQNFRKGMERRELPGEGIFYQMNDGMDTLTFTAHRGGTDQKALQIILRPLVEGLLKELGPSRATGISTDRMTVMGVGEGLRVKVCLWKIQVQHRGEEIKPLMYDADILYSAGRGQ